MAELSVYEPADIADQQGISPAAVEELLKEVGLRGESGERGCAASD